MSKSSRSKGRVLVVAAHPDDEMLGCGGTIARHARSGDTVDILILAEGATSRSATRDVTSHRGELNKLKESAERARRAVGARAVTLHSFPDNRMDSVDLLDVVKVVEAAIARVKPDTVYTHHGGDVNVDHRIVHEAVIAATRPQPGRQIANLYFFEVPSSTEWRAPGRFPAFVPTHFVDISASLPKKLDALRAYAAEMRPFPHPRSLKAVEHLARWRGATVGVEAAEAFVTGRTIKS